MIQVQVLQVLVGNLLAALRSSEHESQDGFLRDARQALSAAGRAPFEQALDGQDGLGLVEPSKDRMQRPAVAEGGLAGFALVPLETVVALSELPYRIASAFGADFVSHGVASLCVSAHNGDRVNRVATSRGLGPVGVRSTFRAVFVSVSQLLMRTSLPDWSDMKPLECQGLRLK